MENPHFISSVEVPTDWTQYTPEPFVQRYGGLDDAAWEAKLLSSIESPSQDGVAFPRFPPPVLQERIHGHSGEHSIREAFEFHRMVTSVAGRSGLEIGRNTRILDFGCGWGRIIRPYMAKTEVRNLFGIEPNPLLLHVARSLNPYVSFVTTGYEPPTVFAPKSFDLVVSWSVFTHLPAQLARSWLDEFARLLRPGGLVFVTAWGTRFIDRLVESKRRMDAGEEIHWFSKLVISMVGDLDSVRRRFEAGEVVYARSESEPNYGDTFMSADGARSIMGDRLELVAHDDHSLAQDLIVYRRL